MNNGYIKKVVTTTIKALFISVYLLILGCDNSARSPVLTETGYMIPAKTRLAIELQTELSSNINRRGDTFIALLKHPVQYNNLIILPAGTQINGIVKRSHRYERFGDRASLLLMFDQIIHPNGSIIPIISFIDSDKGLDAVQIKGKEMRDAKIIADTAVLAGILNSANLKSDNAKNIEDGVIIGASLGSSAVFLSNTKEIKLPKGTEFVIQVYDKFKIPK